jgi:hypothetical protein
LVSRQPINTSRAAFSELSFNEVPNDASVTAGPKSLLIVKAGEPLIFRGKLLSKGWDLVNGSDHAPHPRQIVIFFQFLSVDLFGRVSDPIPRALQYQSSLDGEALTFEQDLRVPQQKGRYTLQFTLADVLDDIASGPMIRFDEHVLARFEIEVQ